MSRIGKKPIPIPKGVTVKIAPDAVEVQGPKGKLRQALPPGILFAQEDAALVAKLSREDDELRKFHGLARSLVANAVAGVTDGFKKELDIVGVGYRAELRGKQVHFALGYSHPIIFDIPNGIDIAVDPVGDVEDDRMRIAQREMHLLPPQLRAVADAHDVELFLEPVGHPGNGVRDQTAGKAMELPQFVVFTRQLRDQR